MAITNLASAARHRNAQEEHCVQKPDTGCLAAKLRTEHTLTHSWPKESVKCKVLTPEGKPNPKLAQMIANGYEPKKIETRTRLGLPPVCSTCHQKVRKSRPDIAYIRSRREGLNEIAQRWGFASWSEFETYQLKSNDTQAFGKRKGK
jgi:hypothetical protein